MLYAAQKTITSLAGLSRKYGQWAANYSLVKIIRGYDVGTPREPIYALGKDAEEKLALEATSLSANESEVSSNPKIQELVQPAQFPSLIHLPGLTACPRSPVKSKYFTGISFGGLSIIADESNEDATCAPATRPTQPL